MIKVRVKFYGLASQKAPPGSPAQGLEVELETGSRVCDLLKRLGFSTARTIVTVDKKVGRWNTVLGRGAEVEIVMPPGGG